MKINYILFLLSFTVTNLLSQEEFKYNKDFYTIKNETKNIESPKYYQTLLKRFLACDSLLTPRETLCLLIGYTENENYNPYEDFRKELELYKLNEEQNFSKSLDKGLEFLKTHPVSIKTIFEVSFAYHMLGNEHLANLYKCQGGKIFEAMMITGTGTCAKSPIFALGPYDGYDFITKFIGGTVGVMGSERDEDGNLIDKIQAISKDGTQTTTLYFIVQHATKNPPQK